MVRTVTANVVCVLNSRSCSECEAGRGGEGKGGRVRGGRGRWGEGEGERGVGGEGEGKMAQISLAARTQV